MKRIFFVSLICSSVFFTSVEAGSLKRMLGLEYDYSETIHIDIPKNELKKKWKEVNRYASQDGYGIVEMIPKRQNLRNRTELISVTFTDHSLEKYSWRSS